MPTSTADVMLVLGDIRQVQKIAESSHNRVRRIARQIVKNSIEFGAHWQPEFPVCALIQLDRGLADSLNEVKMKRERLTQIVLVIVGLLNLALIYFLYMDLRHSSWLLEGKNEVEPMFLSFFIPVGVFLLVAARRPSEHRSMIALAAWWNISHGVVMAIQTVEARIHAVDRGFTDVIIFLVIGGVLLALLPAKREAVSQEVA